MVYGGVKGHGGTMGLWVMMGHGGMVGFPSPRAVGGLTNPHIPPFWDGDGASLFQPEEEITLPWRMSCPLVTPSVTTQEEGVCNIVRTTVCASFSPVCLVAPKR